MPDITDPNVVRFVNEVVRPVADRLVGLNAKIDIEASVWFNTVSPAMASAAGTDKIADGSELDGRTQLTKNDVINFVTRMLDLQTAWDAPGVFDVLVKPAVNPIQF